MELKTSTPRDIDTYPLQRVMDLITDPENVGPEYVDKATRFKLVKIFYNILGLKMSQDAALVLCDPSLRKLIVAIAGGGKTTLIQLLLILMKQVYYLENKKVLYGEDVLCLVFNPRNTADIEERHRDMVMKIRSSGVGGFHVEETVRAKTLHSLCLTWMTEYKKELGMEKSELASDGEILHILERAFEIVCDMHGAQEFTNFSGLKSLYDIQKHTYRQVDDPSLSDLRGEVELSTFLIDESFKVFEMLKQVEDKHEYMDMLTKIDVLLDENEQARTRIQNYYKIVTVDESQDFTPLMQNIVRKIAGNNPLVFVGDEDQTIYDFMGAEVEGLLNFRNHYPDGKVFLLNQNRRCPKNIVALASFIISENTKRYSKKMLSKKDDGEINLMPYTSEDNQLEQLVRYVKTMNIEQRENTVISYRNNNNSLPIAKALYDNGVSFNIIKGRGPMDHELFKIVFQVLDALQFPLFRAKSANLYKALPIRLDELRDLLGWNKNLKDFKRNLPMVHFSEIDYGKFSSYKQFSSQMKVLTQASEMLPTQPLTHYFKTIWELIMRNHWRYKAKQNAKQNGLAEIDQLFEEEVFKFFYVPRTYEQLYRDFEDQRDALKLNNMRRSGVTLSTFHGLKGLEFDEQIMTYMDDAIFPSLSIEDRGSEESEIVGVSEAETRLMYVGMTRPKRKLSMLYNVDNPSHYVKRTMKFLESTKTIEKNVEASSEIDGMGSLGLSLSTTSTKQADSGGQSDYLKNLFGKLG